MLRALTLNRSFCTEAKSQFITDIRIRTSSRIGFTSVQLLVLGCSKVSSLFINGFIHNTKVGSSLSFWMNPPKSIFPRLAKGNIFSRREQFDQFPESWNYYNEYVCTGEIIQLNKSTFIVMFRIIYIGDKRLNSDSSTLSDHTDVLWQKTWWH